MNLPIWVINYILTVIFNVCLIICRGVSIKGTKSIRTCWCTAERSIAGSGFISLKQHTHNSADLHRFRYAELLSIWPHLKRKGSEKKEDSLKTALQAANQQQAEALILLGVMLQLCTSCLEIQYLASATPPAQNLIVGGKKRKKKKT